MNRLQSALNDQLLDPRHAGLLSVIKAARNGFVYGAKVRFPHALVMVFLFRTGTVDDKLRLILRATRQHARNLALYAGLYKLVVYLFHLARTVPTIFPFPSDDDDVSKRYSADVVDQQRRREGRYDTFVAGSLAGYVVFGRGQQSSVNQQITIYVFARVLLAVAKLFATSFLQYPRRPWSAAMDEGNHVGATAGGEAIGTSSTMTRFIRRPPNAWPLFASLSWASVMFLFRWYPDTLQPSLRSSMKYIYVNADHWDHLKNFLWFNQ